MADWKGSLYTAGMVAREIQQRWGVQEAEVYDPNVNCFTFNGWKSRGYRVKKGERSIRSFSFIEKEERVQNAIVKRKYPVTVHLFYKTQVVKNEKAS